MVRIDSIVREAYIENRMGKYIEWFYKVLSTIV
jgi:hypothetical protein